jgi:hypothetical protein
MAPMTKNLATLNGVIAKNVSVEVEFSELVYAVGRFVASKRVRVTLLRRAIIVPL